MKWSDVLDPDVAADQVIWDRGARAVRMRECGLSWGEIGAALGLSREGGRQIVHKHLRMLEHGRRSPVAIYLSAGAADVDARFLARMMFPRPLVERGGSSEAELKATVKYLHARLAEMKGRYQTALEEIRDYQARFGTRREWPAAAGGRR
jgi:hypothetical protein